MSSTDAVEEAPWHAGIRGARANALPGLVLQVAAFVLVFAYYRHVPTRDAVNALAQLHERTGVLFGIISTGLCGGLIPFLYLRSRTATRNRFTWAGGLTLTAFWAYKGFEVDLFYHLLARFVGDSNSVGTIATKMFIDQFVYCPILAVPLTVLVYEWIEARFDYRKVVTDIRAGHWYGRRVTHVLISNLGVWIPAVCIIYALPTALQLPLQNLVLCFFTLLLAHVTTRKRA